MPTHDLVADFGGSVDGQRVTVVGSITAGASPVFTPSTNIFAANGGDPTGKAVYLNASGFQYPTSVTPPVVTAYNAGTGAITLDIANGGSAQNSVSFDVLWGTNNTTALTAWNTWAAAQVGQTILTIPAGRMCSNAGPFFMPNQNLPDVKWVGAGAGSTILSQLIPSEFRFGGSPPTVQKGLTSGGNSARLLTGTAGATSVTLSDPVGFGSKITVGRWCLIAGYDMQGGASGLTGYPSNLYFYEWNKITAYNSGTGVVSLLNPLTQTYKSTWPIWTGDDAFHADLGGPATIWVAGTDYDSTVEMNDLTIDNPYNQSAILCRDVILRRVTHIGPGTYPTQCNNFTADTCTYPQSLEIDKLVNNVTFINSTLNILQFQSASPNNLSISGGTLNQSTGLPKKASYSGIAFTGAGNLQVGCSGYGRTNSGNFQSCTGISILQTGGAKTDDLGSNASAFYTFSGGLMSFPKSANTLTGGRANPSRCFVPGTWIMFDTKYIDQVVDVTDDGTNIYVQFKNTTDWPVTPVVWLRVHPCPDFTMRNCTGSAPELEDWNQAPARIPLYSYSKRSYTADSVGTTAKATATVIGRLIAAKLNVTTPGSVTFHESRFDNWSMLKSDYSSYTFAPTIGAINSGLRTIAGGTTATGAQGTDSIPDLTSIGQLWSPGASSSGPIFSANGSGAVVTVEFTMDQGIPPAVPAAVMPLRFRLHA